MEQDARRQLLVDWTNAMQNCENAKPLFAKEMELRKQVAIKFFPTPVEGVNTCLMEEGWELKFTHKIDRKVDEAALFAINARLRDQGINPDPLIRYKPELDTKAYKSLTTINSDAAKIFDLALISKPASPTIELKPPKGKKA